MAENNNNNRGFSFNTLLQNSDIILAAMVIVVVGMLIIPLPSFLMDFLLIVNILVSLLIIINVMYVSKAVDFSVFPSLLLFTTVFRLALNVSSTRLILTQGLAFDVKVIKAFASFVVSGNYVVGAIIFIILIAVQFMVITKGATRIAEVAARFRLDAMPNKFMAIDQDLNSGIITEKEALTKRAEVQNEANFYGAMDGASKFVQGDVQVGIVITLINVIGGLIIGVAIRREPIGTAVSSYIIFAIGDGLVAQIPSLLISTATGIIITRSVASEDHLGKQLASQMLASPKALYVSSVFLGVLAFVPGFPTILLLLSGTATAVLGWYMQQEKQRLEAKSGTQKEEFIKKEDEDAYTPEKMVELLQVDPLELEIGYALIPLVDQSNGGDLLERIKKTRRQNAIELGLIVPQIRITDNLKLQPDEYQIKINGVPVGKYRLRPSKYLAMNTSGIETELEGEKTMEPAFGLPAVWIDDEYREKAEKKGFTVVDNPSVIATHLTELIKRNAHEILGRQEVKQIIDNVRKNNQALVDELKDKGISVGYVQKVLQQLLLEGISIRNIVRILELVADFGPGAKNIELLTEHVRSGLNRQICEMFADEARNIHAAICSTELESELLEAVVETDSGNVLNLGPDALKTLIDNIGRAFREMRDKGFSEILLVEPNLRSALRKVLQRSYQQAAIISAGEIAPDYNIDIIRVV